MKLHCVTVPIRGRMIIVLSLLTMHTALLAWSAHRNSYTWDEAAHLTAGLRNLKFGEFSLYRVNPPLVRMVAALPVLFCNPETDWRHVDSHVSKRPEWHVGSDFLRVNGERSFWLLTLARWACIPFSLIGASVCYLWAKQLYGDVAALVSLALWSFSPNILAHAQLITSDAAATSIGLSAWFGFWLWIQQPDWKHTVLSGCLLGLSALTKTTWIILFVVWPVVWVVYRHVEPDIVKRVDVVKQGCKLLAMATIALYVLNLAYLFEGTGTTLGEYRFLSASLAGTSEGTFGTPGNRFSHSLAEHIPIPLPVNYVQGLDLQKFDTERPRWFYLGGEWSQKGWWYYYIYAAVIKIPVGTWFLCGTALILFVVARDEGPLLRDEVFLIVPCILVFGLVSTQTGLNRHFRYVLPCFPYAFIFCSRVANSLRFGHLRFAGVCSMAFAWSICSSLSVYPHSLSYFNEVAGGPLGGPKHLAVSNTDWGQDLLELKTWYVNHPKANPFGLAWYTSSVPPGIVGIDYTAVPETPTPGWYALSVNELYNRTGQYRYFLQMEPIAMAGYSIYIYHVTPDQVRRLRPTTVAHRLRFE